MTYSKDKKSSVKWCSEVRLSYADQSVNLNFQCDKYIIMVSLVTAVKMLRHLMFYFRRYLC